MKPAVRRQVAQHFIQKFDLSQRRACQLVRLQRCSFSYRHRRADDGPVRERLKHLAQEHPRWGYRFLVILLWREGYLINHKRVLRLYRAEGLKLRAKRRKKVVSVQRVKPPETTSINQKWSMDFVSDTLSCGRRFRALSVIDCHSRECLAMEVDTSLSGERVVRVLEQLRETRGLPQTIQTDNGPEFTGHALDSWAYRNRVRLFFIEPGKPVQNAHIESFNGKLRNECLNLEWFTNLREARYILERWRIQYNSFRPHTSLDNLPPELWQQKQVESLYSKTE